MGRQVKEVAPAGLLPVDRRGKGRPAAEEARMGDRVVVVFIVTTAVVRLVGGLIGWLATASGERARARTLVAVLRAAGPGAALTDQRPDGTELSLDRPAAGGTGDDGA
jgi:hypothetical protein